MFLGFSTAHVSPFSERGFLLNGKKKTALAILLSLLLFSTSALSLQAGPSEENLRNALTEFQAARKGNESATKRTYSRLRDLMKKEGESNLLLSFLGSTTAMMARHASLPWKKLSLAKEGSKLMDKAVQNAPKDIMIRLVRAHTYLYFPSNMGKDPNLRDDVKFLESAYQAGSIPLDQIAEAQKLLIRFYHRVGDKQQRDQLFGQIQDEDTRKELAKLIAAG